MEKFDQDERVKALASQTGDEDNALDVIKTVTSEFLDLFKLESGLAVDDGHQ